MLCSTVSLATVTKGQRCTVIVKGRLIKVEKNSLHLFQYLVVWTPSSACLWIFWNCTASAYAPFTFCRSSRGLTLHLSNLHCTQHSLHCCSQHILSCTALHPYSAPLPCLPKLLLIYSSEHLSSIAVRIHLTGHARPNSSNPIASGVCAQFPSLPHSVHHPQPLFYFSKWWLWIFIASGGVESGPLLNDYWWWCHSVRNVNIVWKWYGKPGGLWGGGAEWRSVKQYRWDGRKCNQPTAWMQISSKGI